VKALLRAALLLVACAPLVVAAQAWPAKPMRIVAGTGAGGAPDILARIVAHRMGEALGQSIIIDLKPGGGGVIAAEHVAKSPADGYTWLLSTTTNLAVTPFLRRKLPYDTEKDFVPISLVAWAANVLVVGKHVPAANVDELLKIARASPGRLNYGSAGIGTPAHLAGELLGALAGISMTHVPYKGAAQALNDVVGGQIDLIMTSPVAAKAFVQNDKVKLLATTGARRDPLMPQLAPISDVVPGYDITQWWGIVLRTGTPRAIAERVHAELVAALSDEKVRDMIAQQGAVSQPMRMPEFAAFIAKERARYGELVKVAKIPLED
jgi:tripartite-type tricarboxylate transporter receptor subunit TctC